MGDTPELDAAIDALMDALPGVTAAVAGLGTTIEAFAEALDQWLADHAG